MPMSEVGIRRPILVVDDDDAIRDTLAVLLGTQGFRVITAADGVRALEAIAVEPPALILLDLDLPVLDGFGVARMMRRLNWQIPIMLMSASPGLDAAAREIGAVGTLAKPFDVARLLQSLQSVLDVA